VPPIGEWLDFLAANAEPVDLGMSAAELLDLARAEAEA
jgi:hypothetical protein